jgi:hypothetical protein
MAFPREKPPSLRSPEVKSVPRRRLRKIVRDRLFRERRGSKFDFSI